MQKFYRLEDITWANGASRQIRLNTLPPGMRVRYIDLFFDLSGTKDAADALPPEQFARSVALLKIGNYFNIPGYSLYQLNKHLEGRLVQEAVSIPGSGATFDMEFHLRLYFRDPRQPASDDGSIPTELLQGQAIEVTFASATVWAVGNLTVTAGTVRCQAECVHETNVPQLNVVGYIDPGSATIVLPPGVYKDLFILDGTGAGMITRAEIESIDMDVDGDLVWNNALHEQIVPAYNVDCARHPEAELVDNATERFPLIWHDMYGKSNITKQPAAEKQLKIQVTGSISANNIRCVYWRAVEKDGASIARVAAVTGSPRGAEHYVPATVSKTLPKAFGMRKGGVMPRKARLMEKVLAGKLRASHELSGFRK